MDDAPTTTETEIAVDQLCDLLERNGYPAAASEIAGGRDVREATAYIAGRAPYHDDDEGRWLQDYIDKLHAEAPAEPLPTLHFDGPHPVEAPEWARDCKVEGPHEHRPCTICHTNPVTATAPDVDYCRSCFYTGRAHERANAAQVEPFRKAFPDAHVGVEHTGGGCFWLAVRWTDEPYYYALTDGEAGMPSAPIGADPELDTHPVNNGWGYVGRHTDADGLEDTEEYNGVQILGPTVPEGADYWHEYPAHCITDEQAIEAIRKDRAARYVVATYADGTAWSVRPATQAELDDPADEKLPLAQARALARETARRDGTAFVDLSEAVDA